MLLSPRQVTDVLEVIGDFSLPSFSLQQLAMLSKVAKVSQMVAYEIVCEGYKAQTSITVVSWASVHSWVSAHVPHFKGPL